MQNKNSTKNLFRPTMGLLGLLAMLSIAGLSAATADPPVIKTQEEIKTQENAQTLLLIKTTPSGADISLDGKKVDAGKLLPAKSGTYKLVVDMEGYQPHEQQLTIRDGRITRIELTLKKEGTDTATSKKDTVAKVKKAVRIISTCAEGDPRVTKAMATLKPLDETTVVAALNNDLSADFDTVRRASIYILWRGGFKSIEPAANGLIKLCDHEEAMTRGMAALALGANQVGESYSKLVDMVENDKSGYTRRCAAYALGQLGNADAIAVLQNVLKEESDKLVRNNAQAALTLLEMNAEPARPLEIFSTKKASPGGSPRIVSTSPKVGASDVDPSISEITVTFDRDMALGYSWTGPGPNFPPIPEGKTSRWLDGRTCILPVKLEKGRYYRVGINSTSYQDFESVEGVPVRTSEIYFTTKGASDEVKLKLQKPRIVSMKPANGANDVDPKLKEIRITFDRPMGKGFSWTGGGKHVPEIPKGKQAHWVTSKTCVLPVKLKPGRDYRLGLNSPSYKNFTSQAGVALDPVVYQFSTRDE